MPFLKDELEALKLLQRPLGQHVTTKLGQFSTEGGGAVSVADIDEPAVDLLALASTEKEEEAIREYQHRALLYRYRNSLVHESREPGKGNFQGEVVSDLSSLVCRRTGGSRIKHRVKQNWLKMYDKSGLVLRVETVINNPEEFRVRKQVLRNGKQRTEWVAMRKGVAYLFRYREVSLQANARYLDALATVDDPTDAKRALDRLTTPKNDAAGRRCPGFNPLAAHDAELFQSLVRTQLASSAHLRACGHDPRKQSAKVSRTFRRFHAHGLIAKIPHTRRWRVTLHGRHVMATSLYLRDQHFPNAYAKIAA